MTGSPAAGLGADERRAVLQVCGAALALGAWSTGTVLPGDDFAGLRGGAAWAVVAGVPALFALGGAAAWSVPRWRAGQRAQATQLAALRRHVDPGAALRDRVDALAVRWTGLGWAGWLWPLLGISQATAADWHRPVVAAISSVLLVGVGLLAWWWFSGLAAAARRWLAGPPGPVRPLPPPTAWQLWPRQRHPVVLALGVGSALLLVGLGVLVAVLAR